MTRASMLKSILCSDQLNFLMEAHNGVSARIVEEAGFQAIWASSLTISASLGVRDHGELTWSQAVMMLEFMADATPLPILFDGDSGYGDFNTVRRLVPKLEQAGVAGLCLEDKAFPKSNSLLTNGREQLEKVDSFCAKIRAAADVRKDNDFSIIARLEAFIIGWGLEEALERAHAYADAGADAVLVHSKRKDASEVLAFMEQWNNRLPVVIVPTTYHKTPMQTFQDAGVSLVVWANQTLRAAVPAMEQAVQKIQREQSLESVNADIAPVSRIFELQDEAEYHRAHDHYLPPPDTMPAMVIAGAFPGVTGGGENLSTAQLDGLGPIATLLATQDNAPALWRELQHKITGKCMILSAATDCALKGIDVQLSQEEHIALIIKQAPVGEPIPIAPLHNIDQWTQWASQWWGVIRLSNTGAEILRTELATFLESDPPQGQAAFIDAFVAHLIAKHIPVRLLALPPERTVVAETA